MYIYIYIYIYISLLHDAGMIIEAMARYYLYTVAQVLPFKCL